MKVAQILIPTYHFNCLSDENRMKFLYSFDFGHEKPKANMQMKCVGNNTYTD